MRGILMQNFLENAWQSIVGFFTGLGGNVDVILIAILKIILTLVIAKIVIVIGKRVVKKIVYNKRLKKPDSFLDKKADTIIGVSQSVLRYAVYFFAVTSILATLGMGITAGSILATAGIGGIALGLGAQDLIRDVVQGFFMLFENQYAVGDFVEVAGIKGTVEDVTLRTTKIRAWTGELTIIPNGSINNVVNFTRGNMLAVVDVSIAYEEDINNAIRVMQETGTTYKEENAHVVDPPEVLGVTQLGASEVVLRAVVRVQPLTHWKTERELRKLFKEAFARHGIEIPYPKHVIISDKEA